jgi:hypothetical protein
MLRGVWNTCCFCCPWSNAAGTYSSLSNVPNGGSNGEEMILDADTFTLSSLSPTLAQSMHRHIDTVAPSSVGNAFEIEIDAEERREQEDMDSLEQGGNTIELQPLTTSKLVLPSTTGSVSPRKKLSSTSSPRLNGRSPHTLLQPPPAYQYPDPSPPVASVPSSLSLSKSSTTTAAAAAVVATSASAISPHTRRSRNSSAGSAATSGGDVGITQNDLVISDADVNIQRFHSALNDAADQTDIAPSQTSTTNMQPPPRPTPVQLPRRKHSLIGSAAPVSNQPGFVGHGSASARPATSIDHPLPLFTHTNPHSPTLSHIPTPTHTLALPSSQLPVVVRKKKKQHANETTVLPATINGTSVQTSPHTKGDTGPLDLLSVPPKLTVAAVATAPVVAPHHMGSLLHLPAAMHLTHSPSAPSLSELRQHAHPLPSPLHVSDAPPPMFTSSNDSESSVTASPASSISASPVPSPVRGPSPISQIDHVAGNGNIQNGKHNALTPASSPVIISPKKKPHIPAGNPLERLCVPAGVISIAQMESLMHMLKTHSSDSSAIVQAAQETSYADLFAFLAGESRTLAGKVLRPFVLPELQAIVAAQSDENNNNSNIHHHGHGHEKPHLKRSASLSQANFATSNSIAPSMPASISTSAAVSAGSALSPEVCKLLLSFTQWISNVSVNAPARTLTLKFDFGTEASGDYVYLDTPSLPTWVLSSGYTTDKFLVHPLNQPKIYRNTSHRLCLHREIVFQLDSKNPRRGITSVRSGDVSIKKFVSFNCELRTEYR